MKVFIADDSALMRERLVAMLSELPDVEFIGQARDGPEAIDFVQKLKPDVVILDIGLPDVDGYQILKEIRRFSDVPVLMLTVRGEDTDVARGLELGADDYITKPFSHIELIARVQAVLRRAQGLPVTDEERPFTSGKLSVDFARNEVLLGGNPVKLTSTERKLLYHLIRNEGLILSHESLLTKVWGDSYVDARDLLRVHIQHLRQKLEDNIESPNIIVTEHGIGYKFIRPAGS